MIRARQRAAARARGGGATGREITIPLPVKGVMVEAKNAEVSGVYAGELTNWRSTGASLRLRSGHSISQDGETASQRIPFEYGAASEYLAFEGDGYSGRRDHAYISSHIVTVDGNGVPQAYNGKSWSDASFSVETAITPDQFDGVIAHQDRLYFWKSGDDLDFYYGDVGAIMGPLVRFPLGRLGNIRGAIVCLKSLTVDAGHGMNDTLAVFTTTGDIVVYEGLDPGDPQDWRLLTRIRAAPPVSKRAFVQVGSDVWMLTAAGVVSVMQTIRDSSMALVNNVSRPIQDQLLPQIAEGGEWSMHMAADATAVVVNRVFNGLASQFIYRTETRSWIEGDYPAMDWHNLGLLTQFTTPDGGLGTLNSLANEGAGDLDEPITARLVTSWFRLPRAAGITYIKPTIIARGPLSVTVTLLSDHDETGSDVSEAVQTVTIQPDNPADPGRQVALNEIIAVDAVGEVFQLRMEVTAKWAELVHLGAGVQ